MSLSFVQSRKLALWALLCAAAFIYLNTLYNLTSLSYIGTDFGKFYNSSRAYWLKKDIYLNEVDSVEVAKIDPQHHFKHVFIYNLNSPAMVLSLLPIGLVSYKVAYLGWNCISFLFLMLSLLSLWRVYIKGIPDSSTAYLSLLFSFLIFYPVIITFFAGQVTFLLLFLMLLAWQLGRQKSWYGCGILLGIAFTLKLFFGLYFLLLLKQKQWRACFAFIASVAIVSCLTMYIFGFNVYASYHKIFHHITWFTATWNVSLYGFYSRLFPMVKEASPPVLWIPWIGMFAYLASVFLVLLGLLKTIEVKNHSFIFTWDQSFAYCTVAMVLLSPLGWLYYFPLFILPVFILYYECRKRQFANLTLSILVAIIVIANNPIDMLLPMEIQNNISAFFSCLSATLVEISLLIFILFIPKLKPQSQTLKLTTIKYLNIEYFIYFILGMNVWYHLLKDIGL